jgi:hypothetical protein
MTSLSEVYEGGVRTVVGRRRRVLAMGLFAAGVVMGAAAILLTTTGLRSWAGLSVVEAREVAGVLAGLGLPAAMVGIFVALPASDETSAAAVISSSVSVFGVLLFVYAYPGSWLESEPALALATVAIYTLGVLVTFWCLFVAVATFNRRRDPGGAARVEVTDEGTVRLVSSDGEESTPAGAVPSVPGLGGIGLVGRDPDGDVPTQTNAGGDDEDVQTPDAWSETESDEGSSTGASVDRITTASDPEQSAGGDSAAASGSEPQQEPEREASSTREPGPQPEPTGDGGQAVAENSGAELVSGSSGGRPDAYCGNCAYFEYVEVGGDLDPYCGYHQEFMEDLDPCENWTANTTEE